MSYRLTMQNADGDNSVLLYDPHTSHLQHENGESVFPEPGTKQWAEPFRVSPQNPGKKQDNPSILKIQLGLKCNYSCSYCLQASGIDDASVSSMQDSYEFMNNIDQWLRGSPDNIQFWGGEPFVYWAHLRYMVPRLREKFPDAVFSMITNGSLLDDEKIAFIDAYDIRIRISHDAMGQHLRGPDPFEKPGQLSVFKKLWDIRGDKVCFASVLTAANCDVDLITEWFQEKMGGPVAVNFEGIVNSYDVNDRDNQAGWTPEQYSQLQYQILKSMISGAPAGRNSIIADKAHQFITSLQDRRPSSALGQKCGMDKPDQLSVDLKGNVTTCQNVGALGKHGIGHVSAMEEVSLDTARHWSTRRNCGHCPVLQLCKGSCMYNDGDDFSLSCENEFHYNWAVMAGALYWATGKIMIGIEGDIRRPVHRKVIPISLAAA